MPANLGQPLGPGLVSTQPGMKAFHPTQLLVEATSTTRPSPEESSVSPDLKQTSTEQVTVHTACQESGRSLTQAAGSQSHDSFCSILGTGVTAATRKVTSPSMNRPFPSEKRPSTDRTRTSRLVYNRPK